MRIEGTSGLKALRIMRITRIMKAGKRNETFSTVVFFLPWPFSWKSKDYFLKGFSVRTIVLVGIYNQQFKGTILFMVLDFQGKVLEQIAKI